MTAQLAANVRPNIYTDFLARLEFRQRVRELNELAVTEGLSLPMPAEWIATLEALGYVVDLTTGAWAATDSVQYWSTEAGSRETNKG